MFLTEAEASTIDARVAAVESRTGVQIVTAIVGKSDTYAELPWKAFALGAALAAFGLVLAEAWRPEWVTADTTLLDTATVLGVAAACALAAVFVPPFARLFLGAHRRDLEVRQHAQSLFLTRELFATRSRTGVLILVSVFERRIEILPDTGLHARVSEADWRTVVGRMTPHLRESRPFHALEEGLGAAEAMLTAKGVLAAGAVANELSD